MGYDKRIGSAMLDAGLGWGGSCFPKDVKALAYMAEENQVDPKILNTVTRANYARRLIVVDRVEEMLGKLQGKTIGLLGLAFKPNTDDMREAPSIDIAQKLIEAGVEVRAYDPVAIDNARGLMPAVTMFDDPYEMARDSDALLLITEWNEFKQLDLVRIRAVMKTPIIFDGRNVYESRDVRSLGFTYRGIGRGFDRK
jgi:UDPglucose 6-dehydrogenase